LADKESYMQLSRRDLAGMALATLIAPNLAVAASAKGHWRTDLRAIVARILATHPDPFSRVDERVFRSATARLERDLPSLSDAQSMARTMALVALLQDGHTYVDPVGPAFQSWFPVRFYEFSDGYFITAVRREHAELAGLRVLAIGGIPAGEAAARARSLMGADNALFARENLHALSNAPLMDALGLASGGRLELRVIGDQGSEKSVAITAMPGDDPDALGFEWRNRSEVDGSFIGSREDWISGYGKLPAKVFRSIDEKRPPHLRYRSYYYATALNHDAYYIQVNYIENNPDEGFVDFFKRALREVDKLRPRSLIVDFRYNSGGDGSMVTPMIHEFIKREDSQSWRDLYVIAGRKSFSATIMAMRAFKDHTEASFLGEPAGAAYNHFGDPGTFAFPNTGLTLFVSTLRHQLSRSDDQSRTIQIDAPALFSGEGYLAGRDPAVDAILGGEEMRALPKIVATDGGVVARAVYEHRRARFAGLDWWGPTDERALNSAAYGLLGAGRRDEAIAAFALNTTIFPDSWNAWDSLGEAQRARGDTVSAIASYQRSLALNPGNNGARAAIREMTAH
jgi:tetratricopeptide (TPR) repeat protein